MFLLSFVIQKSSGSSTQTRDNSRQEMSEAGSPDDSSRVNSSKPVSHRVSMLITVVNCTSELSDRAVYLKFYLFYDYLSQFDCGFCTQGSDTDDGDGEVSNDKNEPELKPQLSPKKEISTDELQTNSETPECEPCAMEVASNNDLPPSNSPEVASEKTCRVETAKEEIALTPPKNPVPCGDENPASPVCSCQGMNCFILFTAPIR